ncbi:hypothetical protein [uncultured Dokdonia sp.]|uniref:hypothetical protein n=1 Tax=uncultured Dokdonia sp. TaxID=575653 RepID=UPI00262545D2|nr:hypothetical protein [uncultured Dokdonia sp.]
MLKLFNRKKITIHSISIPDFGWTQGKNDKNIQQWIHPDKGTVVSINFFNKKPDLPTMNDIHSLRAFYRDQLAAHKGGLIQVDFVDLKGYKAIKTIFKIPQQPSGVVYLASFTIPFEKFSFVIKIQAPEIGMTGMRDSIIAEKLLRENKIAIGDTGYKNWFKDPYGLEINTNTLMNKSEEAHYDIKFPEHPLSQARNILKQIESEIEFEDAFEKSSTFKR